MKELETEYLKYKKLGLNPQIIKDNLTNNTFVSIIPLSWNKNSAWCEVVVVSL